MIEPLGLERIVEMLLAGTPDRVIEALAVHPLDSDDLRTARATTAKLAYVVPCVQPPASLRERILARKPVPLRPKKPVLVVMDMIREYLQPGGPLEVPRARDIVPAVRSHIERARAAGTPVVYVVDQHEEGDSHFDDWGRHAVVGTEAAEMIEELTPAPGEIIVAKHAYSGFTNTKLEAVLDELGADHLLLTGCATELGIAATAKDALEKGFAVTIPPEAQAGGSLAAEMVTLITVGAMPPYAPRYARHAR